jgi:hypothetical protein
MATVSWIDRDVADTDPVSKGTAGMAKGAGRSMSDLDYDDYTRLPPAAARNDAPFGYDYKARRENSGVREDDGPFGYDYKAPTPGETSDEPREDDVPFNYSYKEPNEVGGEEATSPREAGKETVGAPFNYGYRASEARGGGREQAATTTVFFHEEAVRVGERLRFRFPAFAPAPLGLLPRHAAESIPFSTPALPTILALLRVAPGSAQAAAMAETLRTCEHPPLAGESKFCASSLEALVELAMTTLGTRDVRAITSTLPRAGAPLQPYAVRAVRRVDGESFVACHDEAYPYTVYRCHTTGPARAYVVEMEGAAGTAVTVAAVCHTDTSRWNPEHLSFKLLSTKPGGAPICHIMPYGHIIWAKNVKILLA